MLRAQLALGRDLLARSLAFQACFLSAAAVATRFGAATAAAHQIVLQLWFFQALVLDAVAIAAQSLVGAALGAPADVRAGPRAGPAGRPATGWCSGSAFGVLFAALAGVLPPVFTPDPAVLAAVPVAWWFFVGDAAGRRGGVRPRRGAARRGRRRAPAHVHAASPPWLGFLPLIWASLAFGWGLAGIWSGLAAFMLIRLVAVGLRARSGRWAVTGAVRA